MSRYIDADAVMEELQMHADSLDEEVENARKNSKNYNNDFLETVSGMADGVRDAMAVVYEAPTIDIVRCQDCKYWVYHFNGCSRNPCTEPWYATDFCNYGEREGE